MPVMALIALHGAGRTAFASVLLIAATERGVPHVSYRFLETLGCRWFFPGQTWEVVPNTPNLAFNQDITDRPTIASRSIWCQFCSTPINCV